MLHTLNVSTGQTTYQGNYQEQKVIHPARSLDGRYLVLAPASGPYLLCFDLAEHKGSAMQLMQTDKEAHVSHPSISRDGKLVAVQIKTLQHVGSVNVHDWSSGAYDHTYTAIASWVQVVSYDLETQKEHAVYYQDPEVPDVMKTLRGLGPVFSPTADLLAYADAERVYLCDSHSGEQVRTLPWPEGLAIEEHSGLAFSPDGATLAYLSSRQRGGGVDGTTIYALVLLDIQSGAGRPLDLPETVRPLSTSIGFAGLICLDFSPAGRYIVFTGATRQAGEFWAIAEVAELSAEEQATDLYALDVQTGQCLRLTDNGRSFDPVWKGR
jgi:WD40 repeat protein